MLSFSKGIPIAKILGGQYNGEIIHVYDNKLGGSKNICCEKCSSKCLKKPCCEYCEYESGGCLNCKNGGIIMTTNDDLYFTNPLKYLEKNYANLLEKKGGQKIINDIIYSEAKKKLKENNNRNNIGGKGKEQKKSVKIDDMPESKEMNFPDGTLVPIPNKIKDQIDRLYVAGPTGAGKSTWIGHYMAQYKRMFPKNDIFVFSRLEQDKALDKYKPIHVKFDESIIENPIKAEELRDSLCIFDDIDTIQDKVLNKAINNLKDDLLQTGRHANIYIVVTSHQILNYKRSRDVLNEANGVVFFPRASGQYAIKNFLKEYIGLGKDEVAKILRLPSRWVMAAKNYPPYILHEHGVYLLH